MKVSEGWELIKPRIGVKFRDFIPVDSMTLMRMNKGKVGILLEQAIGLPHNSKLMDFEDGDLKSYKSDPHGLPRETMAIHQVSNDEIDLLIRRQPFADSPISKKIQKMVVLGICKDAKDPADWFISVGGIVDCRPGTPLFSKLETSYEQILDQFNSFLNSKDGMFHTSSGHLIQIRTKDSAPYSPRSSKILNRQISHCRIAFYFQKEFMRELLHRGIINRIG